MFCHPWVSVVEVVAVEAKKEQDKKVMQKMQMQQL